MVWTIKAKDIQPSRMDWLSVSFMDLQIYIDKNYGGTGVVGNKWRQNILIQGLTN